jgi:hypothetical protein
MHIFKRFPGNKCLSSQVSRFYLYNFLVQKTYYKYRNLLYYNNIKLLYYDASTTVDIIGISRVHWHIPIPKLRYFIMLYTESPTFLLHLIIHY